MLPLVFAACVMSCMTNTMQAYHNDNIDNSVNVNDPDYKYGLNFEALFLKPSTQLNSAMVTDLLNVSTPLPQWNIVNAPANYHFAFDLGAKLVVRSKETVLKGNWEHYLSSEVRAQQNVSAVTQTVDSSSFAYPAGYGTPTVYKQGFGAVAYQRDKMNLVYGQLVEVGKNLKVGLFGGVSFTRLHVATTELYATNAVAAVPNTSPAVAPVSRQIDTASSFSGVGPEFSMDLSYHLHKGLSFVMSETVDFLTGTEKTTTLFTTVNPALEGAISRNNEAAQAIVGKGQLEIVPVFSQKIGLQYELPFRSHCEFQVEFGYFSQIYLNALNAYEVDAQQSATVITSMSVHNRMSNFALSGPYFKLDMAF